MKTRVISGVVIAIVLIAVWTQIFNPIFDIFFGILAAAACYEITKAVGLKNKEMQAVAIIFSGVLAVGVIYASKFPISLLCIIYVIFLVIMTVIHNSEVTFEQVAATVYASFIIPIAFSFAGLIADLYKAYDFIDKRECVFFIWFAIAGSLFTDVFAQLTGMAFGKHKMTPVLSPKKTWEGSIGGVLCALILNLLWLFIFIKFFADKPFAIPVWFYILMSPIISFISMFGDLMASFIKRNYGIKDYSNLIPGHGGIMDRFDSVILVMPAFYVMMSIYGLVVS